MIRISLRILCGILVASTVFVAAMLCGVTILVPMYREKIISRFAVDALPYASFGLCLVAAWFVDRLWNPAVIQAAAIDEQN